MTEIALRVAVRDDGRYVFRCGWTTVGTDWAPVGCAHERPRQASDHADRLAERRRAHDAARSY